MGVGYPDGLRREIGPANSQYSLPTNHVIDLTNLGAFVFPTLANFWFVQSLA